MTDPANANFAPKRMIERIEGGEKFSESCPAHERLKHATSRWGVLLLILLRRGDFRFSELRRKINGVSEKMLSQTLQALETDGIVSKRTISLKPLHIEYSLTDNGKTISEKVEALSDWFEINLATEREATSRKSDE